MIDFAMLFFPFAVKNCNIGLYERKRKTGVLRVLLVIVCYTLYAVNITKLLRWPLASVEDSKLIAAAICATISMYAVDILADIIRAIRTPDLFKTSLELRCVCCVISVVLGVVYFAMLITGVIAADIIDNILVVLYIGLTGGIFYVIIRSKIKPVEA